MSDRFEMGQWKVICDRCGFQFKARQLRKEWTNLMVCSGPSTNNCWEPRNNQEKVRGKPDRQAPNWVRPRPPEVELSPNDVTPDDL